MDALHCNRLIVSHLIVLIGGVGVEDQTDPPRVGQAVGQRHPAVAGGGRPAAPGDPGAVGVGRWGHPPQGSAHRAPSLLVGPSGGKHVTPFTSMYVCLGLICINKSE